MTFSDAEEDQPTILQNGTASPNSLNASSSTSDDSRPITAPSSTQTASPEGTGINTEDSSSSTSLMKETSHSSTSPTACTVSSSLVSSSAAVSSVTHDGETSSAISLNVVSNSTGSDHQNTPEQACNSSEAAAPQPSLDQISDGENAPKDLEIKKILEKLQQIHGYIQQTATAMQSLENEGDVNKIGQYNTLVKCMRELNNSEEKLSTHLNKIKSSPAQSDRESGPSGSESMGVIGTLNDSADQGTISERLARHENEQQQLSERLRESLVRREELMSRYQSTRERLNNLKRQRLQYVQEERRLLQSVGVPENPYDDPIRGAETWTTEQLETGITDFQGLRDKVDNLHVAYQAKLQEIDENDVEERNAMQRKVEQVLCKRTQIGKALLQMADLLQAKRENQQAEEALASDTSPPVAAAADNTRATSENDVASPRAPAEETSGSEIETEPEGSSGTASMTSELMAKQQHLQSLKDKLENMKRLLQVTQEAAAASGNILNDPEFDLENETTTEHVEFRTTSSDVVEGENEGADAVINSAIVGVSGKIIHLSEIERRNPDVISKYQQLSEAKQRLANMEEVMRKITEARECGRPIADVLTAENLELLERAQAEEEGTIFNEAPLTNASEVGRESYDSPDIVQSAAPSGANNDVLGRGERQLQRDSPVPVVPQPKKNAVSRVEEKPSNGGPELELEREIAAMQSMHFHLKKATPQIPPVNEGFQVGRGKKGAIKEPAQKIVVIEGGTDPRLQEVRILQEELKEKKNALEALMHRMGKSSSFTLDNISDNISENVSDTNSDGMERHLRRRYFANHRSEDELRDALEERELISLGCSAPGQPSFNQQAQSASSIKNRNRYNPQQSQRNPESNQFSVNNLRISSSVPESVRPKHNRTAAGNIPVTSWEGVSNPSLHSNQSQSNSKVENTVASALSQLSQVQETINSLYGELRTAEMSASRPHEIPVPNIFGTNTMVPQPNVTYNPLGHNLMPNYCMSPLPNNAQGRGDVGPSNYVLAGLQQCFSQLYLHSLEIQSLSKHLQVRPNSYPLYPFFPPYPPPNL